MRRGVRVERAAGALAAPAPELLDLVADGEDLALEPGALAALAELLEGLGLEPPRAATAAAAGGNAALGIRQVGPGVEGAEEEDGTEEDEDEPLAVAGDGGVAGTAARGVDAVDHEHGDEAAHLARGGGHAVARAAVAGGEDLGRYQEGEGISAEVEGEVADGDERDGGGRCWGVRHAVVHAARRHEEHREHQERDHQPLPPR